MHTRTTLTLTFELSAKLTVLIAMKAYPRKNDWVGEKIRSDWDALAPDKRGEAEKRLQQELALLHKNHHKNTKQKTKKSK